MPLTDAVCRSAKPREKPYKLTDGASLYLYVQTNGVRFWRFDYVFDGKRRTASLGRYPMVPLAAARLAREEMRKSLREGRDPSARMSEGETFGSVARSWFAVKEKQWKTSYSKRIWSRIEDDILPTLGSRGISTIEPPEILELLRTIENRDAIYSAKRMCEQINTIFAFAKAEGHVKGNPAADLKAALKPMPKRRHRAKLTEKDLPEFFRRLRASGTGATQNALEFVAHTFVRPNEIRFARWCEIKGNLWTIPGERMKMGKTHLVHLTPQSLDLLARLREQAGDSEWVLPGRDNPRKPVSENTLLYFLYDLGYHKKATVHGFRGTASTALNESGLWHPDWIERQLAHVPDDKVRDAYNAAEYWEHRIRMMTWWSQRLSDLAKPNIYSLDDLLL